MRRFRRKCGTQASFISPPIHQRILASSQRVSGTNTYLLGENSRIGRYRRTTQRKKNGSSMKSIVRRIRPSCSRQMKRTSTKWITQRSGEWSMGKRDFQGSATTHDRARKNQGQIAGEAFAGFFWNQKVVRKKGLEPLRPFGHQLLRLARLPIPPLPRRGTV